jgi:hypothetical protein
MAFHSRAGLIARLAAGLGSIACLLDALTMPDASQVTCAIIAIVGCACVLSYARWVIEGRESRRRKKAQH